MKTIYKIDKNGYLQFGEQIDVEEDANVNSEYVETPLPVDGSGWQLPFYKPKWNGAEWIEDMSQEEINELNNQPISISELDRVKISQAEQFEYILEILEGMM